jgi:adenosine deaminase
MHDFDLHMRIIEALHKFYPATHVSLHADELAMGLVPPEGMRFHIRESIERAGAERIGHGVAVMSERDPIRLLAEMAKKRVLVEICLTSNDTILGISGDRHPLPIYMRYGVPVALATDDEGVSRSDMTHEYLRAVETYNLSYGELKSIARASLEHSFIPGESLWNDSHLMHRTVACADEKSFGEHPRQKCRQFLEGSERARVQWKLETALAKFEKRF